MLGIPRVGSVAQLVERTTENREVTGSTPVGATRVIITSPQKPSRSFYPRGFCFALVAVDLARLLFTGAFFFFGCRSVSASLPPRAHDTLAALRRHPLAPRPRLLGTPRPSSGRRPR